MSNMTAADFIAAYEKTGHRFIGWEDILLQLATYDFSISNDLKEFGNIRAAEKAKHRGKALMDHLQKIGFFDWL